MEKDLNWAVLGTGVIANEMAQALLDIYGVLSDHPDAEVGTRKVHFAVERSKGLVNKFLR